MSLGAAERRTRHAAGAAAAPTLRRYMLAETMIGIAINAALAAAFTILLFGGEPLQLWGIGGLAFDFIPATFLPVLAMTVGLTWVTRRRRRAGTAPTIAARPRRLPSGLVARGILFGIVATALLGLPGVTLLAASWSPGVTFAGILAFKVAYGATLGLVFSYPVLIAALRDPLPPAGRAGG